MELIGKVIDDNNVTIKFIDDIRNTILPPGDVHLFKVTNTIVSNVTKQT